MSQAKRHFAVPRAHVQYNSAGGARETVTVYRALCNHRGYQPNATTDKTRVTCARCCQVLDRLAAWEAERECPQLTLNESERLMLDVLRDRCDTDGMRDTLATLVRNHAPVYVYAALRGALREDIDRYGREEQADKAAETIGPCVCGHEEADHDEIARYCLYCRCARFDEQADGPAAE